MIGRWIKHILGHPLLRRGAAAVALAAGMLSCASIGRLEGGPYDETPPVFVKSNPAPGTLNYNRKRVSIEFDEYIKLDKPGEKVVISPPQRQQPEVKTNGKRVIVTLEDTLKPSTTYTIDFADAIQDNNEGNPLQGFTFTFSTGDRLDTMAVAGTVLNAADLEPVKGILVGLHSNLADSAFTTLPLERVGRTDSRGNFSIRGVAPGRYRIYALQDADQDYFFSQPSEVIAFSDSIIIPAQEQRLRQDTFWIDSLTIDTITEREYTYYLPDDIMLRSFKETHYSQRFIKAERAVPHKFTLYFSAAADTLPTLTGLDFDARDAFEMEFPTGRTDTLVYWIRDSLVYRQDTLTASITYLYTDTLNQLVPATDTLRLVSREKYKSREQKRFEQEQEESKKKRRKGRDKDEDKPKTEFLEPEEVYVPSSMDVYDYITLTFPEPLASYADSALHLRLKVDTLWEDVPFEFDRDSANLRRYNLYADWQPGESYEFRADSLAFRGLYGLQTDAIKKEFKVKKLEAYSTVYFNLTGLPDSVPAFVELLDSRDAVARSTDVVDGKADFYYLPPGKYGARVVLDANGNGRWDTGDYQRKLQPETVYYYPQVVEFKANFEVLQNWNVTEKRLDQQKPLELKKQKPDENKKKNRNSSKY